MNMLNISVTLETCGGDDVGAEVARVARASVDRSKRAEGRRRSTLARRRTRPRGAATSHASSGWSKALARLNIYDISVTRETCGGGGDVEAEVATIEQPKPRGRRASQREMSSLKLNLNLKSSAMSVIADTSQVAMRPYAVSAASSSEVHKSTAVWSCDLKVKA